MKELLRHLKIGWKKLCPNCQKGQIFEKWMKVRPSCSNCQMVFESSPGDTWGFWVYLDRLFLIVPIAILFFGFTPQSVTGRMIFLAFVLLPLIWTMPHRYGVCIALNHYFHNRSLL